MKRERTDQTAAEIGRLREKRPLSDKTLARTEEIDGLYTERDAQRLFARPRCAICGQPATCFGAYENMKTPDYACDTCCGHGNEDGHCERFEVAEAPNG